MLSKNERGQAVPAIASMIWLMAGLALVIAMAAGRTVDRARAQSGADAVALAAVGPRDDSAMLADANRVSIVDVRRDGHQAAVTTVSGTSHASAQAAAARPEWEGLTANMQRAIARAEDLLGGPIPIVSGYRSPADQQRLWDQRHTNPYPVARPGTSAHERGIAIDVPLTTARSLAPLARLTGLCQPLPIVDPVHFVLCPTTPTR